MKPFSIDLPPDLRARLRDSFARLPAPTGGMATEMADLTHHAVSEAIDAIDRVAARASSMEIQVSILSAAISTTIGILEMFQHALVKVAVDNGATVVVDHVQVGTAGQ